MKTDQEILNEGVQTLFAAMDVIDAERQRNCNAGRLAENNDETTTRAVLTAAQGTFAELGLKRQEKEAAYLLENSPQAFSP